MQNIGKVLVGNKQKREISTDTGHASISQLDDVSVTNIQDGYTLVYNSINQKFEAKPVSANTVDIEIVNIIGGTF